MDGFLTIDEVVALLNKHKATIHRHVSTKKYVTREVKAENGGGKNGMCTEIALTSLPTDAQNRYQAQKLQAVMAQVAAKEPEPKQAVLPVAGVSVVALELVVFMSLTQSNLT